MHRLSFLLVLALSACAPAMEGPKKLSPAQAVAAMAEQKVQILDVRTEEEWNDGHLEGATRVEIGSENFARKVVESFDKSKPILVYCRSGRRSARASDQLDDMGFNTIYDLEGGIKAWNRDGQKVVK